MQELVLSHEPIVACGRHRTTWRLVTDSAMRLKDSGVSKWLLAQGFVKSRNDKVPEGQSEDDKQKDNQSIVFDFISYLGIVQGQPRSGRSRANFLDHLVHTRRARCWDPRDKVYGLLGLDFTVSEGFSGAVKPRYDDSYSQDELFYDVAVDCTTFPTGNDSQACYRIRPLLCEVDHPQKMTVTGLPSWVPDWTRPRRTRSILRYTAHASILTGLYAAGGKLKRLTVSSGLYVLDYLKPEFSFITGRTDMQSRGLCIQGKAVDTVEKLTDVLRNPNLTWEQPKDDTQPFNTALVACYALAKSTDVYPEADTTVFEAFWRTLIANKEGSGRFQAPDTYGEIFSLLLDSSTGNSVDSSPSLSGQTYTARQRRPVGKGRLELTSLKARKPAETFSAIQGVFRGVLKNRRFGLTKGGYFGLFPMHTTTGDRVCVFKGVEVPFVVHDISDNALDGVSLVGECYVHGIMNGEVMENENIESRSFSIF